MTKKNDTRKVNVEYGYFSKLLKEPFDTIEELQEAEEAYYAKQKAKEDAAAMKKADPWQKCLHLCFGRGR